MYDCSTENIGRQDQFHPCFYCNLQQLGFITSTNPLVLFLHRICFLYTLLLPSLVRSLQFFCLAKRYTIAHLSQKFGVIPFLHVIPFSTSHLCKPCTIPKRKSRLLTFLFPTMLVNITLALTMQILSRWKKTIFHHFKLLCV